ncbi:MULTISPECIES: GFA family protein [Sinorhizobium]|uniref:GFA family protein n=1 Tax=Sinorhizobium TaxID=28105 RepID=UPI0004B956D1|nr:MULTISPECIES: GFA family protein [Sinorhizobium]ASY59147.1 Gfa-like protein [Sinorhizobium sp. CCBAU 05631]PDT50026.1 aldehyde-activating protein [Sinorhizobium sp. NG07B]POH33673.1 aldehyde-activating protein [Sinorhizobium americanum]
MPKEEMLTGGCLCGKRRYAFKGPPSHIGYCHCSMCRRATGGPSAVLVRAHDAEIEWSTPPAVYRSSPIAVRGFCPDCGSPLFLKYDGRASVHFTLGSFDRPEELAPSGHYGIESRLAWDDSGRGLPGEETKQRF